MLAKCYVRIVSILDLKLEKMKTATSFSESFVMYNLIMTTILKIKLLDRDLFHAYSLAIIPVDAN